MIFAALLVCAGCSGFSPDFDESAWHDRVAATDPKNLYAPHENDGKFFNPWMPMEEKSIGTLLRWRLALAKDYTETEKPICRRWFRTRSRESGLQKIRISSSGWDMAHFLCASTGNTG
ncbi:MAG: hypothetical protein R2861_01865 [Desulfobacterales bacterium]